MSKVVSLATREDPDAFNEFWGLYPRKIGKKYAGACFWRAVEEGATTGEIIVGLRLFLDNLPEERQFIPHPSTWLNQGRWEDEYEQRVKFEGL